MPASTFELHFDPMLNTQRTIFDNTHLVPVIVYLWPVSAHQDGVIVFLLRSGHSKLNSTFTFGFAWVTTHVAVTFLCAEWRSPFIDLHAQKGDLKVLRDPQWQRRTPGG